MKSVTFKYGGIHPHSNKHYTAEFASEMMPLPAKLNVSLWQHLGKPASAAVEKKAVVAEGDVIGNAEGFVSAMIHAPLAGTVGNIANMAPPIGRYQPAVEITVDKDAPRKEYIENPGACDALTNEEILARIKNAGIVGLGGAMFPAHVKLSPPPEKPIDTLIVNAAECEPFITSDDRMMLEKTEEIYEGLRIVKKLVGAKRVVVGIEDNKPKAIKRMTKHAREGMEVVQLKANYPQGGEKQLIQAVTGREVPANGLPMDVGALVHNVGTLFAIYEAVCLEKPLTSRLVTVTGPAIKEPKNLWIPFGTPFQDIIDHCGGITEEEVVVLNGGPMMGFALPTLGGQATVKGTNAVIVLKKTANPLRDTIYQCIRCARCVSVCPINLLPRKLAAYAKIEATEKLTQFDLMSCIECGSCAYACPANIPLVQHIRVGKDLLRKQK